MKRLTFLGTLISASMFFSGCFPHHPRQRQQSHPAGEPKRQDGERMPAPGQPYLPPDGGDNNPKPPTEHVDINPGPKIPPPPSQVEKEEYAVKMPGKPGFVTDPHDTQGRPLDVRGMPPGTKIQSPFSGSVLLVPPQ